MENTTNTSAQNPLSKYFRQPSIYMKLPSAGQFWPEGTVELPVTGEIPVYPMTAKDEILLRTPDALMNGAGVVNVIQSCCPSIKDAWKMPSVDVDAVLIGIRIASYGHAMEVDTKCPHCGEENNHELDLRATLSSISCPDYGQRIEVNNLKIKVQPQAYFGVNRQNTISFEEQRLLEALQSPDGPDPEIRIKQINDSMDRLFKISIDTITNSTNSIELDDGTVVSDPAFIKEFYDNADSSVVKVVQKQLAQINESGAIKPPVTACASCGKEYQVPLEFDYANFFATGS